MAHIPRLFVESDLTKSEEFPLVEGQAKYLTRVMRLTEGAMIRAFNGRDGEWTCTLITEGKKAALRPEAQTRAQYSPPDLTLLFAPLKKARTDFVVEKASELGVRTIQPVLTQYTQSERVRSDRLQTLAIEAAEQTERLDVPRVQEARPLEQVLSDWDPNTPLIYCDEAGDLAPFSQIDTQSKGAVLVGPEGGFSPREREWLRSKPFIYPITLGPRILRAETAVVAALTLWQSKLGDWDNRPYVAET